MLRTLLVTLLTLHTLTALGQTSAPPAQTPAPPPSRQWKEAASLPPGTTLRLRLQEQRHPFECSLMWIDLSSLACETYDVRGGAHRVVYPAAAIASIKARASDEERDDARHRHAVLIGMAAGGLLGGLVGKNASTGTGFALAGAGALIGAGIAVAPHANWWVVP